jgi:hypothetical protein
LAKCCSTMLMPPARRLILAGADSRQQVAAGAQRRLSLPPATRPTKPRKLSPTQQLVTDVVVAQPVLYDSVALFGYAACRRSSLVRWLV